MARILILIDVSILLGILALLLFAAASDQVLVDPPLGNRTQLHDLMMTNSQISTYIATTATAKTRSVAATATANMQNAWLKQAATQTAFAKTQAAGR